MRALEYLGAGTVVYFVMAACATTSGGPGGPGGGGSAGTAQSGGMGGGGGAPATDGATDGPLDALVDAIVNPVKDAAADSATSGTRIKVREWQAVDGAKSFQGLWDSKLAVPCYWSKTADGQSRCLPQQTGAGLAYSDPSCSNLLAYQTPCSTAQYVARPVAAGAGCSAETRSQILKIGAAVSAPAAVYAKSGANCIQTTVQQDAVFHAVTAMPDTEFVAAELKTTP